MYVGKVLGCELEFTGLLGKDVSSASYWLDRPRRDTEVLWLFKNRQNTTEKLVIEYRSPDVSIA